MFLLIALHYRLRAGGHLMNVSLSVLLFPSAGCMLQ